MPAASVIVILSGVTTSGMKAKARGRIGDSALPGSGLYAGRLCPFVMQTVFVCVCVCMCVCVRVWVCVCVGFLWSELLVIFVLGFCLWHLYLLLNLTSVQRTKFCFHAGGSGFTNIYNFFLLPSGRQWGGCCVLLWGRGPDHEVLPQFHGHGIHAPGTL